MNLKFIEESPKPTGVDGGSPRGKLQSPYGLLPFPPALTPNPK